MFVIGRRLLVAATLATAAVITACDSSTDPDDEPEVEALRLTIGTNQINFPSGTASQSLTVNAGANIAVAIAFLDSNDAVITSIAGDEDHDVQVTTTNTAVASYTRISKLAGTIVAGTPGTATLTFGLTHGNQVEFSKTLVVTVQ